MDAAARKRRARRSAHNSTQRSVELPTLALVFLVYGGWLGVTLAYSHWPLWIVALVQWLILHIYLSRRAVSAEAASTSTSTSISSAH